MKIKLQIQSNELKKKDFDDEDNLDGTSLDTNEYWIDEVLTKKITVMTKIYYFFSKWYKSRHYWILNWWSAH